MTDDAHDTEAKAGDRIRITDRHGRRYEGILMPHHAFSGEDIVILKLDSGYNIGIKTDGEVKVEIISKGKKEEKPASPRVTAAENRNRVSIVSTGGTIASFVDYRTGAVHPALTAEDFVTAVPELSERFDIRARVPFSILSEDMTPEHWLKLAEIVAEELNSGSKGVIIPHGTDTMGYTAAAISFLLPELSGPVVLVGSQRSSDRPSSDATMNLLAAAEIASTDMGEVVVAMHGTMSDTWIAVHRGTRTRKMHTSRRDAFESINSHPIARVEGGNITFMGDYRKAKNTEVKLEGSLEHGVALVYYYPGMSREFFRTMTGNAKGVILAGTGLGHVGSDLLPALKELRDKGIPVIMTSQCLKGAVNMNIYSTGRDLLKAGVIPGGDMLPETAYIKLMWVLSRTGKPEEVREMMMKNIAGELSDRRVE